MDWLDDAGFAFHPDTPRLVYGHEPYTTARTYYGTDQARSILAVLERLLGPHVDAGRVELWPSSPVEELLVSGGAVVGVRARRGGGDPVDARAPSTVLTTGGFGANAELFAELEGVPLFTAARETSTGDGLRLARDLGAAVGGRGTYVPTFGGLPHPDDPRRVHWDDRPLLVATERTPWEVYVDRSGRRFVAEDEASIDAKERALAEVADLTFWSIFDEAAVELSPHLVVGWEADDLRRLARTREGLHVADTLEALASDAGIDPLGLRATIEGYNEAVRRNRPDELGRAARPTTIERPPFYAMRNHGITLITFAGLDVDARLRVRREDGSVIGGLYAAGELLGAGATSGNAFCGGMLITPALAFGRLLGRRLAGPIPAA